MGQRDFAAVKVAPIKLKMEECAISTVQGRRNIVASKDAESLLRKEECALGMEQRRIDMNARLMDAQL